MKKIMSKYSYVGWLELLEVEDFIVRQQKADELRSYCHLDSIAMDELLQRLQDSA